MDRLGKGIGQGLEGRAPPKTSQEWYKWLHVRVDITVLEQQDGPSTGQWCTQ